MYPGRCGSVGPSSHALKDLRFDSRSGHILRLWVWSPVEVHSGSNQSMFLSYINVYLSLSLSLSLSPKSIFCKKNMMCYLYCFLHIYFLNIQLEYWNKCIHVLGKIILCTIQYAKHILQNCLEMAPTSIYWAYQQYLEDHKGIFSSSICHNLFINRICWIKSFLLTFMPHIS